MKTFYRISPALSHQQNAWHVEFVKQQSPGVNCASSIGYFKTLKRAKSVVAHFKKKPIEVVVTR